MRAKFFVKEVNNIDQQGFLNLYHADISDRIKKKNGMDYLSWASAWAELKKADPDATFEVHRNENGRFWFDSPGHGAWTEVSTTAFGKTYTAILPVMDFKNKAIPEDKVDVMEANKCMHRCFAKSAAYHGIGLKLYEGEDNMPGMAAKKRKAAKANQSAYTETVSPELKAKHKEIADLCRKINQSGIAREKIFDVVREYNNGDRNQNTIKTIENCEKVLAALNQLKEGNN